MKEKESQAGETFSPRICLKQRSGLCYVRWCLSGVGIMPAMGFSYE